MRIIGCGNPDRGDDAAGLLVARRLRELGFDAREESGEGLALIESWEGSEDVILIDAVMTGRPPGAVTVWDGGDAPLPAPQRGSSHAFGVAEGVHLARALGRMPRRLRIYGIEGRRFEIGSTPSQEVIEAAMKLAGRLAAPAA